VIQRIWNRLDAKTRVANARPLVAAIRCHHLEVAQWLITQRPKWLGFARSFAQSTRAFDILSRLREGEDG
jgi:hypothetical protein